MTTSLITGNARSEKLKLFDQMLKKRGLNAPRSPAIARRAGSEPCKLSFAQQRLWFLYQLEPGNPFYNVPTAVRLTGRLDVTALERGLNEIMRRHEVLRTTFDMLDGEPVQIVNESKPTKLCLTDLSGLGERAREAEAQRLANEEAQLPFNIVTDPMMRARLLKLKDADHIALITLSHIASDGGSIAVLMKEISSLYEAYSAGKESTLEELPVQYANFASWQRSWLEGEGFESQMAYWKEQLAGAPTAINLPTDHARPPAQSYRGRSETFALNESLTSGLKLLTRQADATLYMTLLAVYLTVLHHYTGEQDIVVGSPIANRKKAGLEGLIGLFINMLALRVDLSGAPGFIELLKRVREVSLSAYAHQDLPFEKLVDELQPARDMSRNPLFQVAFQLQNAPNPGMKLAGLRVRQEGAENVISTFDLDMQIIESGRGLTGLLIYNSDIFEPDTIKRLTKHFQVVAGAVVSNPERPIPDLSLLTQAERHQLLSEWNDTGKEYPVDACIQDLFEAQVRKTPNATALVFDDERLTYAELNTRANQLARYLRKLGVGPEVRVGILVDRSIEMLVGLLGTLKAGGTYVPLDPDYRQERVAFMLEDAQISVLLTQRWLLEWFPDYENQMVYLDAEWKLISQQSKEDLTRLGGAENLAYVIYTSGSTGKPKGVQVTHRAVSNFLDSMRGHLQITERDVLLAVTTPSFDIAGLELFLPITTGASVVIVNRETRADGAALIEKLDNSGITIMQATPATWRLLLEAGWEGNDDLKILCGGEALTVDMARQLLKRGASLWNVFGPTETTIWSTIHKVCSEEGPVPIGRPLANTQVYLLNERLDPVPIGVTGGMYIGGHGLARGYLNHADLTAEKFIPDPFSGTPGARMYKTGDVGRYLSDGNIDFMGRIDHQVKVRGFRIEPGEIEAALVACAGVREAVVMAREHARGENCLVAYIVAEQRQAPTTTELRDYLKERLPSYMMPAAFVTLKSLPLTPNGKVDRKALPQPDYSRPVMGQPYVAPRTRSEEILVNIWSQVLGVEKVGVHDNFFALGGDSVLSIRVMAVANKSGLQLIPRHLFQHQTIAELAALDGAAQAPVAEQGTVTGDVPFTPVQSLFFLREPANPHHWNLARLLKVQWPLEPALLRQAIRYLLIHHDALRMRFEQAGDEWQSFMVEPDEQIPFIQIDLSMLPEAEWTAALEEAAASLHVSLNITNGPVIRVALFDAGPQKLGRVLIITHHLVSDAVSLPILLEDLQLAYVMLSRGENVVLPPKTTSFKEWAERLHEYANSEALMQEARHWLGLPWDKVTPLPRDFPEGDNTEESLRSVDVSLSVEETRMLVWESSNDSDTKIMDMLLAALVETFARWTGNPSLLVAVTGHGREPLFDDVDLSRTVGWFNNVYPMVLDLEEADSSEVKLKRIKDQLHRIPGWGMGYLLLRCLNDDPSLQEEMEKHPDADVLFNYISHVGGDTRPSRGPSIIQPTRRVPGPLIDSRNPRPCLIWWTGTIDEDKLHVYFGYSKNIHKHSTIRNLARLYIETLRELIVTSRDSALVPDA
ncbi:MAG: amino acid adenylation domain-containing protein [Blastocatellia bacterium]